MTNGEKIKLALLILKFLMHEDTTHHTRRILAAIAYDALLHNDCNIAVVTKSNDTDDIPF